MSRRNRWQLAAMALIAVMFALALQVRSKGGVASPSGAAQDDKVVRAGGFILEDKGGKPRAGLAVDKDGPMLHVRDDKGKLRALLGVDKDGPLLELCDDNGKLRAGLGVLKNSPARWLDRYITPQDLRKR